MLQIIPKKNPRTSPARAHLRQGCFWRRLLFMHHKSSTSRKSKKKKVHASTSCPFTEKTEPMVCTEVYMSQLQDTHSCSNNTKMCCKLVTAVGKSIQQRLKFPSCTAKEGKEKAPVTSKRIQRQLYLQDAYLEQMFKTKVIYQHG